MAAAGERAPLQLIPPGLRLEQANLCLTREDIIDDSQKSDTHVTNVNPDTLFHNSLSSLITISACTGLNLLQIFTEFINANIDSYIVQGETLYKISIPYGIPIEINVKYSKKIVTEEILVRIMEELTQLEKHCAPFFFVKDNFGFKKIDEKFCLASFYDEGSRRITTGGLNLREYLTRIYPTDAPRGRTTDTTYTINLTETGMTSIPNSSLTAHWDAITVNSRALTEHQILFTLTIGADYVQCVFTYNPSFGADQRVVSYTNSTKTPISCSFFTLEANGLMSPFTTQFITACFSGNSEKNGWFNTYIERNDGVHIRCGRFIQLGKAIGDASFVFSKYGLETITDKRYSVGTSDIALALRCCINATDVVMYIPRGRGAANRYYMSLQFKRENVQMIETEKSMVESMVEKASDMTIDKNVLSSKKTKANKKFQNNVGKKKVCTKINTYLTSRRLRIRERLERDGRITRSMKVGGNITTNETNGTKSSPLQRGGDPNDPKTQFINYSIYYLANISYFFQDSLDYFSNLYTSFSKPSIDTDSTITYDGITYTISQDTFNLDVKKICISKVIDFLTLLVRNTEMVGDNKDGKLLRQLAEKIAEKIIEKEEIFDIYKVFENVPFGVTLLVPVPSSGDSQSKKLSGIPTTQLFEGCEKLLSYLADVGGFTTNLFEPIRYKINELNEKTGTGKKYTINTIFSDVDSETITKASLKKVTDEELQPRPLPPYIQLLKSLESELKRELEVLKKNPPIDLTNSQGETKEETKEESNEDYEDYEKKCQDILKEIWKILPRSYRENKYMLYDDISKLLTKISTIIEYSDLVLIIISSFIRDELKAIVIRNELLRFISIRGTFIFDIKIIEAFIDGLDEVETMGSIIYNRGYDAIDTLINVKENFDGDVIDALNEEGFSLMEIGDFMDELISQITEQELTDDEGIERLITSQIDLIFPKLEQQEQIQSTLDPLGLREITETNQFKPTSEISVPSGGKNNRISNPKHNTKYRKNYKKFVSKYIIKKKKNNNNKNKKNNNKNKKNNKNKTRKNKRLTKSTPNSKRNNKTLKNKKGKSKSKSKSNNHKSKYNKKTKTNYYNSYRHNKTLKH